MNETPVLHQVHSVKATAQEGVYVLDVDITDVTGSTYRADYCSYPSDTFGLNPTIRKWLTDNPNFPIEPYVHVEPAIEEIRAQMPTLTARQLRLGLVNNGYSMSQVSAVIDAMPEGADKETARIEWEYASAFERTHPLIGRVGAALAISEEQIDTMWTAAASL
jgi:hypothetical protein